LAPRLRVIAKYGTGTDNIDLEAATRRGIIVTNCPGVNASSVAEFTLTLILLMLRPVIAGTEWLRSGVPQGSLVVATEEAGLIGAELSSQTVGVIGWGDIGRRVGVACIALGARVIAYDPARSTADIASDGARVTETLDELLSESDVVTLHVPLTFATAGLIASAQLARMRPHAALVNVSRGGVVDEAALADALSSGKLRCAATDVFKQEPPPSDHRLVALPNALCTPHMAGTTTEAFRRTGRSVATAVDDVLSGRLPQNIVNQEVTQLGRPAISVDT
jgi:D-3-phosphoglycerate dehydrogenase / 2-oxoglutarate reductase